MKNEIENIMLIIAKHHLYGLCSDLNSGLK